MRDARDDDIIMTLLVGGGSGMQHVIVLRASLTKVASVVVKYLFQFQSLILKLLSILFNFKFNFKKY